MKKFLYLFLVLLSLAAPARATDITVISTTVPYANITDLGASRTGTASVVNGNSTITLGSALPSNYVGLSGFQIKLGSAIYYVTSVDSTTDITLQGTYSASTGSIAFEIYPFVLLRVYASKNFTPLGASYVVQSGNSTTGTGFFKQVAATYRLGQLYLPDIVLQATTDLAETADRDVRYTIWFYRLNGSQIRVYDGFQSFRMPHGSASTTWPAIKAYNTPSTTITPNFNAYNTDQVNSLFENIPIGNLNTGDPSKILVSDSTGKVDTSTVPSSKLTYIGSLTSDAQTQIDTKAPTASPTFTGTVTAATITATGVVNGGTPTSSYASLPASPTDVRRYKLTDKNRGFWYWNTASNSWQPENGGVYYLTDFGGETSASGATNLAAFNAISTAAESANKNPIIILPDGNINVSDTVTFHRGTVVQGVGPQTSTQGQGSTVTFQSNNNGFVWDGNSATSSVGIGGGLRFVTVYKGATYSGGSAIKIIATDDNHRPGEMIFDGSLVSGVSGGLWAKGIEVDGTAANTAGTRGVRSVHFRKMRVANVTTNNKYLTINQGTHIFGDVELDTGDGTGSLGATIEGFWDDIMLKISGGNVVVTHTGTPGVDIAVLDLNVNIANFSNSYASAVGMVHGAISNSVTNSSTFLGVLDRGAAALRSVTTPLVTVSGGTVTDANAGVSSTGNGNGYLFGHGNAEYRGSFGALSSSGTLFQGFYAYHSSTSNTLKRTSGSNRPSWFEYPTTGGWTYKLGSVSTSGTDVSAPTSLIAVTPTAFTLDSSVTASVSKFSGSPSFTGNLVSVGPESALSGNGGQIRFRDDTATQRWLFGHGGSAGATSFLVYDLVNSKLPFTVTANSPDNAFVINTTVNTMAQPLTVTGNVTATSGDLITSTAGKTLQVKTGSNACAGWATLSSGAATVSTTCIGTLETDTGITLTPKGSSTGVLRISATTANTSFTITSTDATSSDKVYWQITKLN